MKILISTVILLMSTSCFCQDDYAIISTGNKYTQQQIENALDAAELCGFFYSTEERVMIFDDGAVVHLKDQSSLSNKDGSCFIQKSEAHNNEYWEISQNGHLIRRIQTVGK